MQKSQSYSRKTNRFFLAFFAETISYLLSATYESRKEALQKTHLHLSNHLVINELNLTKQRHPPPSVYCKGSD